MLSLTFYQTYLAFAYTVIPTVVEGSSPTFFLDLSTSPSASVEMTEKNGIRLKGVVESYVLFLFFLESRTRFLDPYVASLLWMTEEEDPYFVIPSGVEESRKMLQLDPSIPLGVTREGHWDGGIKQCALFDDTINRSAVRLSCKENGKHNLYSPYLIKSYKKENAILF